MTQRIKVMQIIARMNVGGPAVIVAELMRGLDSSKFEQVLITGYCDETEADYLDVVATIRKFNPDVIHTHTAKAGVLGRLASIIAGRSATRIHTFHGHLLHGYFSGWKVKLVIAIEKFLAKKTDHLIAIGNEVKNDLLAVGVGKASQYSVFFPGLPEPKTADKASLRKELELDPVAIYGTFVGRLTQIKRPDRLLDIASQMVQRGVAVNFLIAGEGELFEECKERARKENLPVTFLGWRKDIDNLFAASDVAILTSDNEGIPLTLIQAAQAGLPIVAPAVGSISDIVENDVTGFLSAPQVAAMASALSALVTDSSLRSKLGAAGKARAHQYFSLDRMLRDHTGIYKP